MTKVLLTGASGFIGRYCVDALERRGYEVHAVSCHRQIQSVERVQWHNVNLLGEGAVRSLMSRVRPSHLLHLAWYVVPGKLIASPENFAWVTTSVNLLREFVEQGGKRFVVAGSGYEYDWNYGYCSERLTPATPNTVYGSCKRALHLMAESIAAEAGVRAAWARVFFLYGPGEHPDRLVASVIRALLDDKPAKCSHGRQVRDYLHVADVAEGLVSVLDSDVEGAVNIASAQATSLREIVTEIGHLIRRPELIELGAIPARANDVPFVVGDNSRLTKETGWTQHFDLQSGLRDTIAWWREQSRQEVR